MNVRAARRRGRPRRRRLLRPWFFGAWLRLPFPAARRQRSSGGKQVSALSSCVGPSSAGARAAAPDAVKEADGRWCFVIEPGAKEKKLSHATKESRNEQAARGKEVTTDAAAVAAARKDEPGCRRGRAVGAGVYI